MTFREIQQWWCLVLIIRGDGGDSFRLQKHRHYPIIPMAIHPQGRYLAIFILHPIVIDVLMFLKLMEGVSDAGRNHAAR